MAKAYKAPNNYERVRYVTHHAVQRLRERLTGLDHRPDTDLLNWIDHQTDLAMRAGFVQSVVEKKTGIEQKLVKLDVEGGIVFAVVSTNDRADKPEAEAIVTILSEEMVTRYRETRWDTDLGHKPFAGIIGALKDELGDLPDAAVICPTCQEVMCECPAEDYQVDHGRGAGYRIARAQTDPVRDTVITQSVPKRTVLISYRLDKRGDPTGLVRVPGDVQYEEWGRAEAPERVAELLDRADLVEGSLCVWEGVPIQIERKVTVKIGGK